MQHERTEDPSREVKSCIQHGRPSGSAARDVSMPSRHRQKKRFRFCQEYGDVCVNIANLRMIPMLQLDESDVFNR
jgi:hypothetical protein